jgi:mono/diheme cytochrome c family protein
MKCFKNFLILVVIGLVAVSGFIFSGRYPIGADVEHDKWVYWLLEQTRERAVEHASKDIQVPDLSNPELLLTGGADYNYMCAECHLKPGQTESDLSIGLYPKPPNFSLPDRRRHHDDEADEITELRKHFWVIKHGIKASGMPAWGKTHSDERIWAMVAFIEKLPELSPEQYQILTAEE